MPPAQLWKPPAMADWWQLSQREAACVGMWLAGLPLAKRPSWQLVQVQLPNDEAWWSNFSTGAKPTVEWQASHEAVVGTWSAGLPRLVTLLWQLAQRPGSTLACENSTALNDEVPWQASQARVVGMCLADLASAPRWLPCTWQLAQSFGVPLKMPLMWQVSQRTSSCLPVSEKPVVW